MKYIIIQYVQGPRDGEAITRELPILFPNGLTHANVAEYMQHAIREESTGRKSGTQNEHFARDFKVVGAGELASFALDPMCGGKSETLDVESRGIADSSAIKMIDYSHGIVETSV